MAVGATVLAGGGAEIVAAETVGGGAEVVAAESVVGAIVTVTDAVASRVGCPLMVGKADAGGCMVGMSGVLAGCTLIGVLAGCPGASAGKVADGAD